MDGPADPDPSTAEEPAVASPGAAGNGTGERDHVDPGPHKSHLTILAHRVARVLAVSPVVLGVTVLVGWALGWSALTRIGPGLAPTVPLTAVMLIGLGGTLTAYPAAPPGGTGTGRRSRWLALVPAAVAGAVATVVLLEWVAQWDAGIDLLLWRERVVAIDTAFPGRPSPGTVVAVLTAVVGALLLSARGGWWTRSAQILAGVTTVMSASALLGYLFDRRPLQMLASGEQQTAVGVLTAVGLTCAGVALLAHSAPGGLTRPAFSSGPGGALARRLLPAVVVLPPALAALLLQVDWEATSDVAGALAALSVATVVALTALLLLTAERADRLDRSVNLERDRRRLLELARARAQLISAAGDVLSRSASLHESMAAVAATTVPAIADAATVDLRRPDGTVVRAVVADGTVSGWRPVQADPTDPRRAALDTGEEMLVGGGDPSLPTLRTDVGFAPSGAGGAAAMPVVTARGCVGALAVINERDAVSPTNLLMLRELARRIALAADAREGMARFRAAFEQSVVGWALAGAQAPDIGRFVEVNERLCDLTGRDRQNLLGRTLPSLAVPDDRPELVDVLSLATEDGRPVRAREVRLRSSDDRTLWAAVSVSTVSSDGVDEYLLVQVQDVSVRREAEARLLQQALHDPLTGLANRTLLWERLEHALDVHRRGEQSVAVLLLDLDRFKQVNDTYGHEAGDELLTGVGDVLQATVRPGDTVARLGGDEFVVLLDPVQDEGEARSVAHRIEAALRVPITVAGRSTSVSASIGVTLAQRTETADQVLRHADVAMYRAKRRTRAQVAVAVREEGDAGSDALVIEVHEPDGVQLDGAQQDRGRPQRGAATPSG